ncbi:DUF2889 domain-containing protein [Roseococcus sp. SYP-B2431]|uniref:DUF2889 domain-containing protein n=1 Tax=Roseococcus sp. SYP-B2431 TaxID=2496640 RepID=UPI001039D04A|nr:DUF2889 domain-containing protein [Roseococcus sp. SYP-B2431]TCH96607.1 DUF2889 domain-containing protein [Roseococcus sp. SYP-B2431]
MPLSSPSPRKLSHLRDISLRGYAREDGQVDIEAHLTDTKTYGFPSEHRGDVHPGDPIHGMWVRMTVDMEMRITACEAVSDHTPFAVCPGATPNFAKLAGLTIGAGFNRAVNERVGGVLGCTHLREVIAQMATVAFQTVWPMRKRQQDEQRQAEAAGAPRKRPHLLGTCHAYAPDSPVVRKKWPEWSDLAESAAEKTAG